MSEVIQIREVQETDVERVVEMSRAVAAHEGLPASNIDAPSFLAFGFGRQRLFHCYVAVFGGRLVGHICITHGFDFQEGRPVVWIADLYVEPSQRRRGIARLLVGAAARQARDLRSSFIQWMIAPDNKLAGDFYRSIGARHDRGKPMYLGTEEIMALASIRS